MQQDPEKIPLVFKEIYTCSLDEAKEAITYVQLFMEDYDPKDVVEYKQEVEFLLNTWEKIENDKGSD
ncbi:MAG: hypothetical protein EBW74_09010 [Betaproteobacteria bacterium]|nr:hypothetical protein [Betaproteobacteria bacterium]